MKSFKEIYSESKYTYDLYHRTYAQATSDAYEFAKSKKYDIDEDSWTKEVTLGPKKPSPGKYNSIKVNLLKNGKPVKHMLVFQVYNRDDSNRSIAKPYELNAYIS